MPNRDHDDTPYNRSEGRFESTRYDRDEDRSPYQREGSYRSSRDWERRDDARFGERSRGYNPARDDYGYRGGSRYEDRGMPRTSDNPQGYDYTRGYTYVPHGFEASDYDTSGRDRRSLDTRSYDTRSYDTRAWDEDDRWRQRLRSSSQDSYGQGNFGRPSYARSSFGRSGSEWGGSGDWNRDYTRDWDRDYRGDAEMRSRYGRSDEGDFGEQLRHAGHQLIGKVKRAFRGPRGYKRSDERIREDVNDRLAQQDELDPSDIEVRVENGDVTLTGSVRNRHEKFRAEEIADDVSGVNEVHNQLRIGSPQPQTTSSTVTGTSAGTSPSVSSTSRNGRA